MEMLRFPPVYLIEVRNLKLSNKGGRRIFLRQIKMIPTPIYTEQTLMGPEHTNIFSKLLSDRIIMLFDEINDTTACTIISQLLFLEAVDPEKDIYLYINSSGGSVNAGLAIYDTIRHIKCDVSTLCIGQAYSMAAFLLAAGTKGKRYSMENSSIMIHQALSAIPYGQATDIKIHAQRINDVKNRMNFLLSKMTDKSIEEIEKDCERDFFLSPNEAVTYGLIDEVIHDDY